MQLKNLILFSLITSILLVAIIIGNCHGNRRVVPAGHASSDSIPDIGPVQVLNGCGRPGAGDKMADFLRSKKFDVKFIGNARSANYPYTMVIGRTDMKTARKIENVLQTGHCVLLRNEDRNFEATVIIGPDFQAKIQ